MWRVDFIEWSYVEKTMHSKYGTSETYLSEFPFPRTIMFRTKKEAEQFVEMEIVANSMGQDIVRKRAGNGICYKVEVKSLEEHIKDIRR